LSGTVSKPDRPGRQADAPAGAAQRAQARGEAEPGRGADLPAGLYLVATPIGNLRDITLRALDVLKSADLIACEDTRVTSRLSREFGISTKLQPYHDHNAARMRPALLQRIKDGGSVALVSDAGTPLVSDPGYKLVREAAALALPVIPIPGASSVLAALTASGLPTDKFHFAGFIPAKEAARTRFLSALKPVLATLILFETGPRLARSLAAMAEIFPEREGVIARELTKHYEEIRRDGLNALAGHYNAPGRPAPKGEIVVLAGPPNAGAARQDAEDDIDRLLGIALETMSLKDAVAEITNQTGLARKIVYSHALALTKQS